MLGVKFNGISRCVGKKNLLKIIINMELEVFQVKKIFFNDIPIYY